MEDHDSSRGRGILSWVLPAILSVLLALAIFAGIILYELYSPRDGPFPDFQADLVELRKLDDGSFEARVNVRVVLREKCGPLAVVTPRVYVELSKDSPPGSRFMYAARLVSEAPPGPPPASFPLVFRTEPLPAGAPAFDVIFGISTRVDPGGLYGALGGRMGFEAAGIHVRCVPSQAK